MIVRVLRIALPAVVLGLGLWVGLQFYGSRPPVVPENVPIQPPLVRVLEVVPTDLQWTVRSQGTVVPPKVARIVAEVAARVTWVSESLIAGGFFRAGDVLVRLEKRDFELAEVQADAELARARLRLEQERAEAEVARREWEELGRGQPSALTLRKPQLAQAEAEVAAAEARLEMARRDLERAEIRASFDGRVRSENVVAGEFVGRGAQLAEVYSIASAEVRLPLPDSELAYLDLPLDDRDREDESARPAVILSAEFAGSEHRWRGRIVRTEGEIDVDTRMLYAVARVEDPYGASAHGRPPLAAGLFVKAEVLGRRSPNVVVLPRAALRGENTVLVVSDEDTLHFREVEVLRRQDEEVVIGAGLEAGERVCISPLESVVEGMRVRTAPEVV